MSDNGSGVAVINSAGQPVVATTLITATAQNALTADLATMLSNRICKDGQTTVTANIPFGGFKATSLANGSARTDAANLANVQDGTGVYVATVGGTADAITLTAAPAITAYAAGQTFRFIASGANTTNVTVAISGLAAKAITKNGTTALVAGDIPSGTMVQITYDGTRFILGTLGASLATLLTDAIRSTLVDAKGDILVATAADTVARKAVGSNGTTLKADSTTSDGVRYGLIQPGWGSTGQLSLNNAGTPNTQFDLIADYVRVWNPTTGDLVQLTSPGTITNNTATAGSTANGRDQAGAFAAGFVYFYWIYNGTTTASLSSNVPPPTGPTLPSGYTHWSYAGAVYYDGAALRSVRIHGNTVWYPTAQAVLSSGSATTETAVGLGAYVPGHAAMIYGYTKHAIVCAGGAGNYRLTLRSVSTADFQVYGVQTTSQDATGTVLMYGQDFAMLNVSQQLYYLFTVSTGTSPAADILITGYTVPNGGAT